MARSIWQKTITDDSGNIQEGAQITVRDQQTGNISTIYTSQSGGTTKGNPFLSPASGVAKFFAYPGFYKVTAFKDGKTAEFEWNNIGDNSVREELPGNLSDLYAKNNILGTVSQSGGTPTGGIIERGSNANGDYIKFADGTLICTRSATYDLKQSGSVSFALPELFFGTPGQHVSSIQSFETQQDIDQFCSAAPNPSASVFRLVRGTDKGGVMNDINITLTAIGRWY